MSESVKHTPYVVGGVYRRQVTETTNATAVMVGGSRQNSGVRQGVLYSDTYAPARVVEGHSSLDEWELVAAPLAHEAVRQIESGIIQSLPSIEARLLTLEEENQRLYAEIEKLKQARQGPTDMTGKLQPASEVKKVAARTSAD